MQVLESRTAVEQWPELGLVFTTIYGTPLEERRVVKIFKEALAAAGLPQSIRLYDCRHTAASLLYAQGVPELQIAAILGHTDSAFTRRTYTRCGVLPRTASRRSWAKLSESQSVATQELQGTFQPSTCVRGDLGDCRVVANQAERSLRVHGFDRAGPVEVVVYDHIARQEQANA